MGISCGQGMYNMHMAYWNIHLCKFN